MSLKRKSPLDSLRQRFTSETDLKTDRSCGEEGLGDDFRVVRMWDESIQ